MTLSRGRDVVLWIKYSDATRFGVKKIPVIPVKRIFWCGEIYYVLNSCRQVKNNYIYSTIYGQFDILN